MAGGIEIGLVLYKERRKEMKINKNSWHYRLVYWSMNADFDSEPRCCSFNDSMMPHTSCAYFAKLFEVSFFILFMLFLAIIVLAVIGGVFWILVCDPFVILYTLAFCGIVIGILLGIYITCVIIKDCLYRSFKQWLNKFCKKVEYA